jgi:hypothetical protein
LPIPSFFLESPPRALWQDFPSPGQHQLEAVRRSASDQQHVASHPDHPPLFAGRHVTDIPDQHDCFAYIHRSFVLLMELM